MGRSYSSRYAPKVNQKLFLERLETTRAKNDRSESDLETMAEITPGICRRWRKGVKPRIRTIQKIALTFDVDWRWLKGTHRPPDDWC